MRSLGMERDTALFLILGPLILAAHEVGFGLCKEGRKIESVLCVQRNDLRIWRRLVVWEEERNGGTGGGSGGSGVGVCRCSEHRGAWA